MRISEYEQFQEQKRLNFLISIVLHLWTFQLFYDVDMRLTIIFLITQGRCGEVSDIAGISPKTVLSIYSGNYTLSTKFPLFTERTVLYVLIAFDV